MKFIAIVAPLVLLAACSPPAQQSSTQTVQMSANARSEMERVNAARFTMQMPQQLAMGPGAVGSDAITAANATAPTQTQEAPAPGPAGEAATAAVPPANAKFDAGMVRIEVLLDRAHFSPGVIDGYDGENVRKAVTAYQTANNLPANGLADDALLTRLEQSDSAPALVSYVITPEDVAGPFVQVPTDLEAMSHLQHVGYQSAEEALAEKFHMDEDLLRTLNPGVDFTHAGSEIVVANAGGDLNGQVARIEVDKGLGAVRAYDASNQILAFYPATIGSPDAPAPTGDYTVRGIAFNPTYHYDPARLPTFGHRNHGALTIQSGPNNPVGVVWIALSADTYGIHGAPQPQQVSKTQSHGCVRLTNWDATELGHASHAGVPVHFVEQGEVAQSNAAPSPG
jgi:lipoprotein-anchoring transpeptidase ErfK/SrfK